MEHSAKALAKSSIDALSGPGLNVRKLEESTMESMSQWFNDKEHADNSSKRILLKEIFKVAKAEERYKKGEIGKVSQLWTTGFKDLRALVDGTTYIPVMCSDGYGSGSDDDEPVDGVKDEDGGRQVIPVPITLSTPGTLFSPTAVRENHAPQQPKLGDLCCVHDISACQCSQYQLGDYIVPGDGPCRSSGPPQVSTQQDPNRLALLSFTYHPPQKDMHGWENGTASRDPTSASLHISTSSQFLAYLTTPYQPPQPISEHRFETLYYPSLPISPGGFFKP
jgi:hypothetical protein